MKITCIIDREEYTKIIEEAVRDLFGISTDLKCEVKISEYSIIPLPTTIRLDFTAPDPVLPEDVDTFTEIPAASLHGTPAGDTAYDAADKKALEDVQF